MKMKNMKNTIFAAAALLLAGTVLPAQEKTVNLIPLVPGSTPGVGEGGPTEGYAPSFVQTHINVNVKDDQNTVHFIRDNTDPYVLTKAYPVKYANPYALRGYLLNVVNAKSMQGSQVQVDALKFNDGTALLLVSAEATRFEDCGSGESIDAIIAKLDRKDLSYGGNTNSFLYFPKINSAECLREMIANVGASVRDSEFSMGIDTLRVDSELNALVVSAPMWSWKSIMEMLDKYDAPAPEIRLSFKVYEIYLENDDKIGVDFQAWKNNDGIDFFSAGARIRRNWSTLFTGNVANNRTNNLAYWNYNPKWNSRYIDVLAAASKAKILHSGMLVAKNREKSTLRMNYGYFYDLNDVNTALGDAATNPNPDVIPRQPVTKIIPENILSSLAPDLTVSGTAWRALYNLAGDLSYQLQNYAKGHSITDPDIADYIMADGLKIANSGMVTTFKTAAAGYREAAAAMQEAYAAYVADPNNKAKYQAYLQSVSALQTAKAAYESASTQAAITESLDRVYDKPNYLTAGATGGVIHGKLQIPMAKKGFLFYMEVTPVVTQKAAQLEFHLTGISMLGFNSDGTPRLSDSHCTTRVQIPNGVKEFAIDDIQKVEIVRGVAGLPWLKDLPVIGWLVSDENESTKKSRLVVVLRAEYSNPKDAAPAGIRQNIGKIIDDVDKAWKSPVNNMGFQQLLLDTKTIE